MLGDAHAVEDIVGPGSDLLDQLVSSGCQRASCFPVHNSLHQVEPEVSLDALSGEEKENLLHDISVLPIL